MSNDEEIEASQESGDLEQEYLGDEDELDQGLVELMHVHFRSLQQRHTRDPNREAELAAAERARLERAAVFQKNLDYGAVLSFPERTNLTTLVNCVEMGQTPKRIDFCRQLLPSGPSKVLASLSHQLFSGKFSPDGQLYAASSQDCIIRLFDTSNWSISKSIRAREVEWAVLDVDYSADKKWLAYCTWSDKIQLVNSTGAVETHQAFQVRQSTRGRFGLFSLRFSPQSTEVIGGSSDGGVYLCDLVADKTIRFEGHEDDVNAVTFLNDGSGNVFLSGSDDHFVRVWDKRADEKCIGMFAGHSSGITSLDSRDDRYCCSNSKDQSVKLWDLRTLSGACRKRERARRGPDIDYRGPAVLSNLLRTLCSSDDESVMTYRGHQVMQTLCRAFFSPAQTTDSRFIYSGSYDGSVKIWDVLTGEIVADLRGHRAVARDVSWHPFLPQLCSVSWDGTMRIWNAHSRLC